MGMAGGDERSRQGRPGPLFTKVYKPFSRKKDGKSRVSDVNRG
jgi:hypothetical protein